MSERAAGGEGVGRGARGRSDGETVSLNGGQVLVVAKELEERHVRARATVNDKVVENLKGFSRDGGEAGNMLLLQPVFDNRRLHQRRRLFGARATLAGALPVNPVANGDFTGAFILLNAAEARRGSRGGVLILGIANGTVDGASEPHSEVNANTLLHGDSEIILIVGEIKGGQETKGAEVEGDHGWNDALEEP